ncbi:hypothetical protein NQZ79_g4686 [Umbelopsis isabellina]|nr:hypothetical protein NQZ79_g4686 [Umbelopsis isabellina]
MHFLNLSFPSSGWSRCLVCYSYHLDCGIDPEFFPGKIWSADRAANHHVAFLSCTTIGISRFLYYFATKRGCMGVLGICCLCGHHPILVNFRPNHSVDQELWPRPKATQLFDENYKDFFDSARNPNVKPSNTQDSWVIEDIENTPENSRPPTRNATRTGWKWASKGRSKQTAAHDVNMEKTNMHRYETPTQLEEATELPSTQAPA